MSCITIVDRDERYFAFACTTTGIVFGPLCWVDESHNIDTVIRHFMESLEMTPRSYSPEALCELWNTFADNDYGAEEEETNEREDPRVDDREDGGVEDKI